MEFIGYMVCNKKDEIVLRTKGRIWNIIYLLAIFGITYLGFMYVAPAVYRLYFEEGIRKGFLKENAVTFNDTPSRSIYEIIQSITEPDSTTLRK
jgi:hypothetical protein